MAQHVQVPALIFTCACCLFETYSPTYLRQIETTWGNRRRVRTLPMCGVCAFLTNTERDAYHAIAVEAREAS